MKAPTHFFLICFSLVGSAFFTSGLSLAEGKTQCTKLVANKYCLGGSLNNAIKEFKDKKEYEITGNEKDGFSIFFVDENVFEFQSAYVILSTFRNSIYQIRIMSNASFYTRPSELLYMLDSDARKTLGLFSFYYPTDKDIYDSREIDDDGFTISIIVSKLRHNYNDLTDVLLDPTIDYRDKKLSNARSKILRQKAGY